MTCCTQKMSDREANGQPASVQNVLATEIDAMCIVHYQHIPFLITDGERTVYRVLRAYLLRSVFPVSVIFSTLAISFNKLQSPSLQIRSTVISF